MNAINLNSTILINIKKKKKNSFKYQAYSLKKKLPTDYRPRDMMNQHHSRA